MVSQPLDELYLLFWLNLTNDLILFFSDASSGSDGRSHSFTASFVGYPTQFKRLALYKLIYAPFLFVLKVPVKEPS